MLHYFGGFLFNMKLQTFTNCKDKKVQLEIDPLVWLDEVKNGYTYKQKIEEAREDLELFGKIKDGKYTYIKENNLPVCAWNCRFDSYKKNENAKEFTGYLYYDIDNQPNFNVNSLNKDCIFSFYQSLSKKGWGVIVKVDGLNKDNFRATYTSIATELGIDQYYDKNACSIDRNNVLTYDVDVFVNTNCKVFKAVQTNELIQTDKKPPLATYTKKEGGRVYVANGGFYKIRLNNASDFVTNPEANGYQFFDLKVSTTQISFPQTKLQPGARNKVISTIFGQMLLLNPDIPQKNAFKWLNGINKAFCVIPMTKDEVVKIFQSNWKNAANYSLSENKQRAIIFTADCKLTKEEKQSVAAKWVAKTKTSKTKEKIYLAIEEWQLKEKITTNTLVQLTGLSKRTIERYLPEFKEIIKEKNK